MEVIIFKKNEILTSSFKNQKLQTLIHFNSFSELKNECYGNYEDLDTTKCNIDLLDKNSEKNRRAAAKYLHEYELVKLICKKQVISRAYFKLYEMVYHENIILITINIDEIHIHYIPITLFSSESCIKTNALKDFFNES